MNHRQDLQQLSIVENGMGGHEKQLSPPNFRWQIGILTKLDHCYLVCTENRHTAQVSVSQRANLPLKGLVSRH